MSKSSRVVLLVSDQPASRALARAIVECGIIVNGIIIQIAKPPVKTWKRRLQLALGDELYLRLSSLRWPAEMRKLVFAERQMERNAEQTLARFLGAKSKAFPQTRILRTESVNSDEAHQFLEEQPPDLLAVYATGLLRKRTMEAGRLGAVNAHTSLLPDYRGTFAEFWQIYDRAYDKTGITFHFIDEGVDTGDIVYRQHVPVSENTDPSMLRALNTIQIVRHYPAVIQKILAGSFSRSAQGPSSTPCFRAKDLTADHKKELFQRLKAFGPTRTYFDAEYRDARIDSM